MTVVHALALMEEKLGLLSQINLQLSSIALLLIIVSLIMSTVGNKIIQRSLLLAEQLIKGSTGKIGIQ